MDAEYLLLENGGKLLLENGSGALLLEVSVLQGPYLLLENGGRILLENGSGALLLEAGFVPPTPPRPFKAFANPFNYAFLGYTMITHTVD